MTANSVASSRRAMPAQGDPGAPKRGQTPMAEDGFMVGKSGFISAGRRMGIKRAGNDRVEQRPIVGEAKVVEARRTSPQPDRRDVLSPRRRKRAMERGMEDQTAIAPRSRRRCRGLRSRSPISRRCMPSGDAGSSPARSCWPAVKRSAIASTSKRSAARESRVPKAKYQAPRDIRRAEANRRASS